MSNNNYITLTYQRTKRSKHSGNTLSLVHSQRNADSSLMLLCAIKRPLHGYLTGLFMLQRSKNELWI